MWQLQHPPPSPEKSRSPLSQQPPSKSWSPVKPQPFWKFGWRLNPPPPPAEREGGLHTMLKKPVHPNLTFNNSQVSQTESQKHLGLISDNKLNFNEHLKGVLDKISKTMGVIRKFQLILPRFSLLTIYKTTSWLWRHNLWSNLKCFISQ